MSKKRITIAIAVIIVMVFACQLLYNHTISNEYVPADDEIALHIQLDTKEDIGLLIYDYCANAHEYSGGISNANRSLLKHNDKMIVVWNKQQLNNAADTVTLSIQFRIITEYVDPNYENVYPENITKYTDPIAWEAHLGQSYFITITGDNTNGYTAVLSQSASSTAMANLP